MHIEKLSLFNFKNYHDVVLNFSEKVNCVVGINGSGKTNLLDAIYYLSLTKSAFNNIDSQNIKFGESVFSIKGRFNLGDKKYEVLCAVQEGAKKTFKVDKKEYEKLSEHVGRFPVVMIAPNDVDVIREGSEIRRRFFDTILCQIDGGYLETLMRYNQVLKQRNSALKQFAFTGRADYDLISTYDAVLLPLGNKIYERRSIFIEDYRGIFKEKYAELSEKREDVTINYRSDLEHDDFDYIFRQNLKKDLALERTTMGVHRDDFRLIIQDRALKKFGSQGQQKSFLVALKMAHLEIINDLKGFYPILLLDDIFDKLDSGRIRQLVKMITDRAFGQIFITDAREERTKGMLDELGIEADFYHIENGSVKEDQHE